MTFLLVTPASIIFSLFLASGCGGDASDGGSDGSSAGAPTVEEIKTAVMEQESEEMYNHNDIDCCRFSKISLADQPEEVADAGSGRMVTAYPVEMTYEVDGLGPAGDVQETYEKGAEPGDTWWFRQDQSGQWQYWLDFG